MNINELVVKEEKELSVKQREFLETHNNIISSGVVVANGLVALAQNLKHMRDEKLYVEAGFKSFEEYSENACGLKQRQAYNYIKVLEDLGGDFLQSNAKIGVTKLTLLSSLSDDDREEVLEKVVVEDVSVSELKKQIEDLKSEKNELSLKVKELKNQPAKVVTKIEKDDKAEVEIKKLKEQLKEKSLKLKNTLAHMDEVNSEVVELKKSSEISVDSVLLEFKIKFENFQSILNDLKSLLDKMSVEKREKCELALKKVLEGVC